MPSLLDQITAKDGRNVLFLAYGQTGTGKTHTMFGTKASLEGSTEDDPGWGLFPRVVNNIMKKMEARGSSVTKYQLFLSAIEFYLMEGHDLFNKNVPIVIDDHNGI